jgi:hypothetical protein
MILTDLGIDLLTKIMDMVVQMRKNALARVQAVWRGRIQRVQASATLVYRNTRDNYTKTRLRQSRQLMDWILKREGVRGPYVERNSVGYTEAQYEAVRGYFMHGQLWKYNRQRGRHL